MTGNRRRLTCSVNHKVMTLRLAANGFIDGPLQKLVTL
jgi:hypothetical protein